MFVDLAKNLFEFYLQLCFHLFGFIFDGWLQDAQTFLDLRFYHQREWLLLHNVTKLSHQKHKFSCRILIDEQISADTLQTHNQQFNIGSIQMLNQVFKADDGLLDLDNTVFCKLTYVLQVSVLFVRIHWIIRSQILQLVIVSEKLFVYVFCYVFPLLVDIRCDTAQKWCNQLIFLSILQKILNELFSGFSSVDFQELFGEAVCRLYVVAAVQLNSELFVGFVILFVFLFTFLDFQQLTVHLSLNFIIEQIRIVCLA